MADLAEEQKMRQHADAQLIEDLTKIRNQQAEIQALRVEVNRRGVDVA